MSAKVKIWFSAGEFSRLGKQGVAGLPTSDPGCTGKARKCEWETRSVECMGGKSGMRTEYQPPADVLAQIHAFLKANPDFFGKDKRRATQPEQLPQPRQPAPPVHAAYCVSEPPPAAYYQPQPCPADQKPVEMKDEWLAAALSAVDKATDEANRYVTPLNKAKIIKKVLQAVACYGSLEGVSNRSTFEMAQLVKPLADLLVSQQPTSKPNSEDGEFPMVKDRFRKDNTGTGIDTSTH